MAQLSSFLMPKIGEIPTGTHAHCSGAPKLIQVECGFLSFLLSHTFVLIAYPYTSFKSVLLAVMLSFECHSLSIAVTDSA